MFTAVDDAIAAIGAALTICRAAIVGIIAIVRTIIAFFIAVDDAIAAIIFFACIAANVITIFAAN